MAACTLRLARRSDFAAIADLTNHYIRTTSIHFAWTEVTADELERQWQLQGSQHPWLVAEVDGAFAGYAKSGPWRERAAYQWTPETGIYLPPGHVGRGLGRTLYERLLALLRAQGFHSVVAGIALPNPASVRLHEALGFRPCGTVADAGWKQGAWHAVGFWQLALAAAGTAPGPLRAPAEVWAQLWPA